MDANTPPIFDKYHDKDYEVIEDEQIVEDEHQFILIQGNPITHNRSNQYLSPNFHLEGVCLTQELGSIDFIVIDQFVKRSNCIRYDDYHGAESEYSLCVDWLAIKGSCFLDPIWEILRRVN